MISLEKFSTLITEYKNRFNIDSIMLHDYAQLLNCKTYRSISIGLHLNPSFLSINFCHNDAWIHSYAFKWIWSKKLCLTLFTRYGFMDSEEAVIRAIMGKYEKYVTDRYNFR